MRNILTVLTLIVLTLASSSVFAEKYDDSKRTERLGLSFYDGRPMYYVYLGRPIGSVQPSYPVGDTYVYAERLRTGDDITKLPNYSPINTYVFVSNASTGKVDFTIYGYDDDGTLKLVSERYDETANFWMKEALARYGEAALMQARLAGGDVGVNIFDALLEPLSQMLRGWFGVVLAIGAVMFGWNFIRELWTLDFSGASKSKSGKGGGKNSAPLSYSNLSKRDRSLYEDAALGSIGIESSQLLVPKEIKKEVDFVTGAAFGLKFDEKTRESNRLLLEAFNRLSRKEQKEILQAFRETAFDKSFEDSAEKRFLAYQGEVFDDVDNPFTGRAKRRTFDPLDGDELAQGYGSDYVGWADMEIDDANASLDAAYYEENGGTPF